MRKSQSPKRKRTNSEGQVYLCGWERKGDEYRVWIRSNPGVKGKGATLNSARESMWRSVIRHFGDGEPIFEFRPALPDESSAGNEVHPEYALVFPFGNYGGHLGDGRGALFDQPSCSQCGMPRGRRTAEPLKVEYLPPARDHGMDITCSNLSNTMVGVVGVSRYAYSAEFLARLTKEEREAFEWREVQPFRRTKRQFYELVADRILPYVAKKGIISWTRVCPSCQQVNLPIQTPPYLQTPNYFSQSDIPSDAPAFAAGAWESPCLCVPIARWRQLTKQRSIQGIMGVSSFALPQDQVAEPEKIPAPIYEKLEKAKQQLWEKYRDELLGSPTVKEMQKNPKLSDSDVWDFIHAQVDDKLAFPQLYRQHL